jgi:hypothetical protein
VKKSFRQAFADLVEIKPSPTELLVVASLMAFRAVARKARLITLVAVAAVFVDLYAYELGALPAILLILALAGALLRLGYLLGETGFPLR